MSLGVAQGTLSSLAIMERWSAALAGLGVYREAADGLEVARQLAPIVGQTGEAFLAALLQQSPAERTTLFERLAGQVPPEQLLQAQTDAVRLGQMPGTTRPLKVVALGDVHGKWNKVQKILDHEFPLGYGIALSVGDLVSFPRLKNGHRLLFITGNHERFSVMGTIRDGTHPASRHYTYLETGSVHHLGGLAATGFSGVHSPHFFEQDDSPPMYFTKRDLVTARSIPSPVDILVMHDAPQGIGFRKKEGGDLGNFLLKGLVTYLAPRLVLFGHHHQVFEGTLGETQVLGLDHPWRSYATILFDPSTQGMKVERHVAEIPEGHTILGYQYPWEHGTARPETLFGPIMLQKKERIEQILRESHKVPLRKKMEADLISRLRGSDPAQKKLRAEARAAVAVNGALPFAAEYIAALEQNPHLSQQERKRALETIYWSMCGTASPDESSDVVRAFQGYLQAMGVVLG